MANVEIDKSSGFCFGVVTAIHKAEEELAKGGTLYCLGDIVHNSREVERLKAMGLITINHEEFSRLHHAKVLLRAHGEPPETYETARKNQIEIIDATCPVVLQLQKRIKQEYNRTDDPEKQIVIYGKSGHAEVLGLVGQTAGKAIFNQKELAATSPKVTLTAGISLVKTTQAMVLNGPNATWDINACALNMDICDLNYSEKASDKDLYHLLDMSVNAVSTTNDALSYAYNALRKSLTTNKEDSDLFKLELSATKAKTTADECLNAAFILRVTGLYNRT